VEFWQAIRFAGIFQTAAPTCCSIIGKLNWSKITFCSLEVCNSLAKYVIDLRIGLHKILSTIVHDLHNSLHKEHVLAFQLRNNYSKINRAASVCVS